MEARFAAVLPTLIQQCGRKVGSKRHPHQKGNTAQNQKTATPAPRYNRQGQGAQYDTRSNSRSLQGSSTAGTSRLRRKQRFWKRKENKKGRRNGGQRDQAERREQGRKWEERMSKEKKGGKEGKGTSVDAERGGRAKSEEEGSWQAHKLQHCPVTRWEEVLQVLRKEELQH